MPPLTPFSDPDDVLSAIKPVTDLIHTGLFSTIPKTRKYFDSRGLDVDKALHAMLTRFELKHYLLNHFISADNEEDVDQYTLEPVANCGLVVKSSNCVLRVLKWQNFELPHSASDLRYEFYQHNLYAFELNDPYPNRDLPPLNLVAAWNTTDQHDLSSFSIVCPWGEDREKKVNNKWWRTLPTPPPTVEESTRQITPEPQLDEITAKGSLRESVDLRQEMGTRTSDAKKADRKRTI